MQDAPLASVRPLFVDGLRVRTMRPKLAMWLFGMIVLLLPGCGLSKYITKNVFIDPVHFDYNSDNVFRHIRDKRWAEEAWQRVADSTPFVLSKHYRRGFEEGYIDYLNNGGSGEPPLSPPRRYWALFYQSPEGNEAIQDWFAGFRHGAAVAKESGYRDLVVIPTHIPPAAPSDAMRNATKMTDKNGASIEAPQTPTPAPVPRPQDSSTPESTTPTKPMERVPAPEKPTVVPKPDSGVPPRPKDDENKPSSTSPEQVDRPKEIPVPKLEKPKPDGSSETPKRPVDQPEPPKKPAPDEESSITILPIHNKHGEKE